jgi:hypothetical protein
MKEVVILFNIAAREKTGCSFGRNTVLTIYGGRDERPLFG